MLCARGGSSQEKSNRMVSNFGPISRIFLEVFMYAWWQLFYFCHPLFFIAKLHVRLLMVLYL